MSIGPRLTGSPRHRDVGVSVPVDGSSDRPSPDSCEPGSFSRAVRPLRSSFGCSPGLASPESPLARRFNRLTRPLLPGVSSLIATSPLASTNLCRPWEFHLPLGSVLRLSQPHDGLLRQQLRGLVSSRGHVQGFPSRGFSRSAAATARRRDLPPCRSGAHAHRRAKPAATHAPRDFEASFRESMRSTNSAVNLLRGRSPPRFSSSPRSERVHHEPPRSGAIRSWRFPTKPSTPLARSCWARRAPPACCL